MRFHLSSIVLRPKQFLSFKAVSVLVTALVILPTQLDAQTPRGRAQVNSTPTPTSSVAPATPTVKPGTTPTPTNSSQPTKTPTPTVSPAQPPVEDVINLLVKLNEKRVYVYRGDKLITKYPIAIGKKGWETPTGEWQVLEKIKNPSWTSFKTGKVVSSRVENVLGSRWIGFWTDGQDVIGFHGTSNLKSIGTAASHGCVRMFNRDVKALYRMVKVGTNVKVVKE
jgi:lipoprotein-anchoring transpeptidase ErfK/SrfK